MARRVEEQILDDINGEVGAKPRNFELDGSAYQIDLSDKNSAAFDEALALFVAHARRVGRTKGGANGTHLRHRLTITSASGDVVTAEDRKAIRKWQAKNHKALDLPAPTDRGRIPRDVVTAYREAQKAAAAPVQPDVPLTVPEAPKASRAGRKAIPQPPANELLAAYTKGTLKDVAAHYGVSTATAQRWVNNAQLSRVS